MANRMTPGIIHHDKKNMGPGPTGIESGESTALFSLSSDGGGGEGRGEESRFYWTSPLPNPLPARSSRGEGDRGSTFQCLIQWRWPPALPRGGRIVRCAFANPERLDSSQRGMRCPLSLRERARVRGNETQPTKTAG